MTGQDDALAEIDVVVLAGGLGTRLRPAVGDAIPKVLAPIAGRPFLEHLATWLSGCGVRRLVLCLGHLAGQVVDHLARMDHRGLEIVTVIEPEPMGTAGALRLARTQLRSDPVLVMNGDTWLDVNLARFAAYHRAQKAEGTLLVVPVGDAARYGRVELDGAGCVNRFAEKEDGPPRPGLIYAGAALLSQDLLDRLGTLPGPSLERDFMQRLTPGSLAAYVCDDARFVDIGTPQSLAAAAKIMGIGRQLEKTRKEPGP